MLYLFPLILLVIVALVFNDRLREIVDAQTDPWGIRISAVEVKQVDLA